MNSAEKEAVLHCLKSMIDETLCEKCLYYRNKPYTACEEDCIRLAIKALEQEPCTDAISRQAVLEIMDWGWKKGIYPTNKIANLPLVSPKQSFESMTNGEVIKALFPDNPIKEVLEQSLLSEIGENWWNAQYGGDAE